VSLTIVRSTSGFGFEPRARSIDFYVADFVIAPAGGRIRLLQKKINAQGVDFPHLIFLTYHRAKRRSKANPSS
jgi:hypothetical protein